MHSELFIGINRGGSCKTRLPRKIDDFGPGCHGQQSWPGRSDEANLNKLVEDLRGRWAQKGDFNGQWSFAIASGVFDYVEIPFAIFYFCRIDICRAMSEILGGNRLSTLVH